MAEFYFLDSEGAGDEIIEADTLEEAVEIAKGLIEDETHWDGEEIDKYYYMDYRVGRVDDPDISDVFTHVISPPEPACKGGKKHRWAEVSVYGHGGGVISTDKCRRCGCIRTTDTWAQRPDTGEEGLEEVTYRMPTHEDDPDYDCDCPICRLARDDY